MMSAADFDFANPLLKDLANKSAVADEVVRQIAIGRSRETVFQALTFVQMRTQYCMTGCTEHVVLPFERGWTKSPNPPFPCCSSKRIHFSTDFGDSLPLVLPTQCNVSKPSPEKKRGMTNLGRGPHDKYSHSLL
eukprot:3058154-Amphidinium_carterae.1